MVATELGQNKIDVCYSWIELDDVHRFTAAKLRGFLGYLFINDPEFHHHSDSSYHYPLIQYKIINNKPCVMGIAEYSPVTFMKLSELEYIVLPHEKVRINNVSFELKKLEIRNESGFYRFKSPWLALNQKNYVKFKQLKKAERKGFLEKILIGNILSLLKGLKIFIDFKIEAALENIKSLPTTAHENMFQGFTGVIRTNIYLPNYFGVGKSVSKGYGVLEQI